MLHDLSGNMSQFENTSIITRDVSKLTVKHIKKNQFGPGNFYLGNELKRLVIYQSTLSLRLSLSSPNRAGNFHIF